MQNSRIVPFGDVFGVLFGLDMVCRHMMATYKYRCEMHWNLTNIVVCGSEASRYPLYIYINIIISKQVKVKWEWKVLQQQSHTIRANWLQNAKRCVYKSCWMCDWRLMELYINHHSELSVALHTSHQIQFTHMLSHNKHKAYITCFGCFE